MPIEEFKDFLERLARGSMSESPTAVSQTFVTELINLMKMEQCLCDQDTKVDMHKLRDKMEVEQSIDVELFNQMLKQDCLFKVESTNYQTES